MAARPDAPATPVGDEAVSRPPGPGRRALQLDAFAVLAYVVLGGALAAEVGMIVWLFTL